MAHALPDPPAAPAALHTRLVLCGAPAAVPPGGEPITLSTLDAALLALLAIEGPTSRQRLLALLWPDEAPDLVRNRLRQRLFALKRRLGTEVVEGNLTLSLAPSLHWPGFEHEAQDRPFLGDADHAERPELTGWLRAVRERLQLQRREQLAGLASDLEQQGRLAEAIVTAQQLLALEPCQEHAHRRVMRLHYLRGDRAAALLAFDRCEQVLKDEVGAAPSAETLELLAQIDHAQPPQAAAARRAVPATVLRPPRLIGRDTEWARLQAAWERGEAVVIVGEAGMGKTRLLGDLVHAMAPAPARALLVTARPGDERVPYALLSRLLRGLLAQRTQALAPGVERELARLLPELPQAEKQTADSGARARLLGAVEATLRDGVAAQLQAVALDDLHFADAASLEMAQHLAGSVNLRWLAAFRGAEIGAAAQGLVDTLTATLHAEPVTLQPLDVEQVSQLVGSLGIAALDAPALAGALHQRSGGNPLFLLETLKALLLQGGTASHAQGLAGLPASGNIGRLIERRLGQLSREALSLARCAAIAGQAFSAGLAARVMQTPAIALADAWAELESAGVLREQAFAHDLVYEATLASVPAAVARQLHAEVAAYLEADGQAPAATLARHWLAAAQPQKAAAYLQKAAEAAVLAYDVAEAASLWAQLSDLHLSTGNRATAFDAAFEAAVAMRNHTTGNAMDAATARLHGLADSREQKAAAWRQQAELAMLRGQIAEAAACAERGLQVLGEDAAAVHRKAMLNTLGLLQRRQGQVRAAAVTLRQAMALARSNPSPEMDLPSSLNNLGLALQDLDEHLEAIALMQEAAERQRDPSTRARTLNNLAISLEEIGQPQLAQEQRLGAARAVAGSGGMVEMSVTISLGGNARALCHFREALQHLNRAAELAQDQRSHREPELHRNYVALWLQLGRVNLAREAAARMAETAGGLPSQAGIRLTQAQLLLALRRPGEAIALLESAAEELAAKGSERMLRRVRLTQAQVLPPEQGQLLMLQALALPQVARNTGAALPLSVRAAQAALAVGDAPQALRLAEQAAGWLGGVFPTELTPAEVWLTLARAAEVCGDLAAARAAAARGTAFVLQVAHHHVDQMYREGWRSLNPVNAELAALAARLGLQS